MGFADEYYYQDYNEYGDPEQETAYWSQPEPQPEYQPTFQPQYEADAYYEPQVYQQAAEPAWYETAGKNLADYALANPKDVLGMGAGAGMGLWGLLKGDQKAPGPDLSTARTANAGVQNQLQTTQGLNAEAVAKLRGQIGGDYGDYSDAARARQAATAQLEQLMANGPDYTLQPEETRAIAELAQKWSSKGMMGSSLHNQELQALKDSFRTNALARYQSQLKSLQDITNTFSGQTSREFSNTGNVVNQGESRQLQGLGQMAQTGIQEAALKSQVDQGNTKLEADRANQLLKVGGDIFGRSFANPAADVQKEQGMIDPRTGKRRTGI